MGGILNREESSKAKVEKYQFGKLELDFDDEVTFTTDFFKEEVNRDIVIPDNEQVIEVPNDLLEKVEILTSEIVTLQMEIEEQKKSYLEQLEAQTKEAYNKGKEEGIKETSETFQNENDELKSQLIHSITILEEQKNDLDAMFENIEEDLIESSILIAKKVIKKEIENDSIKIVKSISSALIETLKNAGDVTLKVNKNDFKEISEHFNSDSIIIMEDEAVSRGGVIILSNSTNIDGTIQTRLSKAMELIGKE